MGLARYVAGVLAVFLLAFMGASPASAVVMWGEFTAIPEGAGAVSWGDGTHTLRQEWSVGNIDLSGYVYGSNYGPNGDVYNAGVVDPTTVADASVFPFQKASMSFVEGDTIFFRGSNGYYGGWVTHDVYPSGNSTTPYAFLSATWFIQSDGTASFVPEPAAGLLALLALPAVMGLRRRRRHRSPLHC